MKTTLHLFKTSFRFAPLLLLLFLAKQSVAQQPDTTLNKPVKLRYPKNNVKMNLSSLALNNYSFYLERSLSKKVSFSLGYRTMPSSLLGDLPAIKKASEKFSDGDELFDGINSITASNKAYTGEFRFYGGKKPGARGFYLSLYGRYTDIKLDYDYTYEAQNGPYSIPIKSSFKGIGGGLMIGAQWLIAKRVTFDWYVLGGHYGKLTGNGNGLANLTALSANEKAEIKSEIEDTGSLGGVTSVTANVNNTGLDVNATGPFIGLRGLGFSLGIAF